MKILPVKSVGVYNKRYYALRPVVYLYNQYGRHISCNRISVKEILNVRVANRTRLVKEN